ncbi:hypothetical protein LguiA_034504 [Lonicera macranthoides]
MQIQTEEEGVQDSKQLGLGTWFLQQGLDPLAVRIWETRMKISFSSANNDMILVHLVPLFASKAPYAIFDFENPSPSFSSSTTSAVDWYLLFCVVKIETIEIHFVQLCIVL